MTNPKRQRPEFTVTYWGEDDTPLKTITVRPAPFMSKKGGLADVINLQEKLLKAFVEHDGRLAGLLSDKGIWDIMLKLAAILPVAGQTEVGFDIEAIAASSDIAQLGRIFFSGNIADDLSREKDENGNLINEPSLIAKIHDINFSATLFKMVRDREEEQRTAQMARLEQAMKAAQQSEVQEALK